MITWDEQKKLAERVGISPQFVNDILHRRRPCPPKRAYRMAKAYYELFGVYVPGHEFTFNATSNSPIFRPMTYEERRIAEEARYGTTEQQT